MNSFLLLFAQGALLFSLTVSNRIYKSTEEFPLLSRQKSLTIEERLRLPKSSAANFKNMDIGIADSKTERKLVQGSAQAFDQATENQEFSDAFAQIVAESSPAPIIITINQFDAYGSLATNGSSASQVVISHGYPVPTPYRKQTSFSLDENGNLIEDGSEGTIRFEDVQGLMDIADKIGTLFSLYYEMYPDGNDLKNNTNLSTQDKIVKGLEYYNKVKTFALSFNETKEEIVDDLFYLKNKAAQLEATEAFMLEFYGLTERFSDVQGKTAPYVAMDKKFALLTISIGDITDQFAANITEILTTVAGLEQIVENFALQIEKLITSNMENQILNVLVKVDQILMMMNTILQLRTTLQATITQLKLDFKNLPSYRKQLTAIFYKMDRLASYYKIITNPLYKSKKDAKLSGLLGFLVALLLFLAI